MRHLLLLLFVLLSCKADLSAPHSTNASEHAIQEVQATVRSRFDPPQGYMRQAYDTSSFASYLRQLPLLPRGAKVAYYNGQLKSNNSIYVGVIDQHIGNKNLHQCADAVIRLRGDYLYKQQRFQDIHFNFTNGFKVDYDKWMKGFRIHVDGNKTKWVAHTEPSNTEETFWSYLEQVFMYAGTASLEKELQPIPIEEADIGDVFIKGGFPGHAVIIVDKVINPAGRSQYLLAQSYMPAQQLQILANPSKNLTDPWYELDEDIIITPEWTFYSNQLRRFSED